jgi:hypothetical protein
MRSNVASSMAESNPLPFPFCFNGDPFSTTETGVSDPEVEGRRALVFNLGLAKVFNCLSAQSESATLLVPSYPDKSDQLATPSGNSREENRFQRYNLTDRLPRVHTSNSTSLVKLGESLILEN